MLRFGAAVGGGIPVLEALDSGLLGNGTNSILGILNGTTNFILTRMAEGMNYAAALKLAQERGFAEANPAFDVEGKDTAQKLSIIFSLLTGVKIGADRFSATGITAVDREDLHFAAQLGLGVKLLGQIHREGAAWVIGVAPTLIPSTHPLAGVHNEINAVHVAGAANITLVGEGAGGAPTANAVVSDIIAAGRILRDGGAWRAPFATGDVDLVAPENVSGEFYLKFYANDVPGTLVAILSPFANAGINIGQAIQLENNQGKQVPVVIITHTTTPAKLEPALAAIAKSGKAEFKLMMPVLRA